MICFLVMAVLGFFARQKIHVDYDMNDYLPSSSPSTIALEKMEEKFDGAIPNARVMIKDVSVSEAVDYKEKLEAIDGVRPVVWLDSYSQSDRIPIELYPDSLRETYYKDRNALFTVTIDERKQNRAVPAIYDLIGEGNSLTGSAVSTAVATESTVSQIRIIALFVVLFLLLILMLTTDSWLEPFVILLGLGAAIMINSGSNLMFGTISFVTNAAGNILQMAVSLDYSVFLIHRFEECRAKEDPEKAMVDALCFSTTSILSSGLTTIIGFLALVLMQFRIGPDLGLALAKGIAISLLTVFLFMPSIILLTFRQMERLRHKPFVPSFKKTGNQIRRIAVPVSIAFLVAIIPSFYMSTHNSYYFGASHIFGEGTRLGDDTAAVEDVFGKNDTYVVMVPVGNESEERELISALEDLDEVSHVLSVSSMTGPEVPTEMLPDTVLKMFRSEHYSRMLVSVNADYDGEETFALVKEIRNLANRCFPEEYYLAGQGVSTYDLMDTITSDMIKVNLIAILAVFIVLLLSFRSIVLPLILVATIETAIWIGLSIPYLSGQPLFYIAYLIISSVQLGATVDYAILFTERYRENRTLLRLDKKESITKTVSDTAVSILTSGSTLTVVGFLMGVISTHGVLSQLGYLLGRGTICSILAVLFVLPGFLNLSDRWIVKKGSGG